MGAVLLVTRRGEAFDAAFVSGTMIYHDKAGRSDAAGARLAQALSFTPGAMWTPPKIAALRLTAEPDETAWLTGDGWWLSTAP